MDFPRICMMGSIRVRHAICKSMWLIWGHWGQVSKRCLILFSFERICRKWPNVHLIKAIIYMSGVYVFVNSPNRQLLHDQILNLTLIYYHCFTEYPFPFIIIISYVSQMCTWDTWRVCHLMSIELMPNLLEMVLLSLILYHYTHSYEVWIIKMYFLILDWTYF